MILLIEYLGIIHKIPIFCRLYNSGNSSKEEQLENGEHAEESVIHDITGTTVYVVGVICVIPAAGLVAWVVRYVVKKKVRPFYFGISIVFINIYIIELFSVI